MRQLATSRCDRAVTWAKARPGNGFDREHKAPRASMIMQVTNGLLILRHIDYGSPWSSRSQRVRTNFQ